MPQRQLEAWGLPCAVIAPSLIPRRPRQRIKTDTRDAKKLVGLYRAGELTLIRIPTPAEEDVREFVRCREAAGADALRAQHRLRQFLLRRGLRCPAGPAGSQAWWTWVRALRVPDPAAQRALDEYCLAATTLRARWKALDPAVAALVSREPWVAPVARLRFLRGIDTLTAVTVLLEVFNFPNFGPRWAEHNPRWVRTFAMTPGCSRKPRRGGRMWPAEQAAEHPRSSRAVSVHPPCRALRCPIGLDCGVGMCAVRERGRPWRGSARVLRRFRTS